MSEDTRMVPIVVSLDGALITTNILVESANQFVCRQPQRIIELAVWLYMGEATVKERLRSTTDVVPEVFPYNEELISWLKQERKSGISIVLAATSNRSIAERVAKHAGVFDEVLVTEPDINLKADAKSKMLVDRFGVGGFDYIGSQFTDLPVWASARRSYLVGKSPSLMSKIRALGNLSGSFSDGRGEIIEALFSALRPYQWIKNLLIFVPLLAAHRYSNATDLITVLMAFVAFCLLSSSVYLINDLVDLEDDRHHHRKRNRVIAAGRLSIVQAWIAWPILTIAAFGLSLTWLPQVFSAVLVSYLVITLAYSMLLKQKAIIDVLALALLYTLRIFAGATAISVTLSFWLASFSMFLFLSLAFIKRFSELSTARVTGNVNRVRGRGYWPGDLEVIANLGGAAGYMSVLVLALYIQSPEVALLYRTPQFIWLACPVLLYWISRTWLLAHRGQMHDDPIVFAVKDRISWIAGGVFAGSFYLAQVVG